MILVLSGTLTPRSNNLYKYIKNCATLFITQYYFDLGLRCNHYKTNALCFMNINKTAQIASINIIVISISYVLMVHQTFKFKSI